MIMSKALPQVIRVYCEDCQKLIPKKTNQSWKEYSGRKYCNKACLARNQSKMQIDAKAQLTLPDGTVMPLGNYIKKNTNNLRDTVDFYIGVTKRVQDLPDDIEEAGKYKGIVIDKELVKESNKFLVENSDGKPGQRTLPADIDLRNASEKLVEMEFILRELGYRMVKIDESVG